MKDYIGVFDSGVGGLSILKSLIETYPKKNFVYLGDTARLPYGTKSKETIKSYVSKNIEYLRSHYNIKGIVVACNSASSVLSEMPHLKNTIGVIEAGANEAIKKTKSKKVALWATKATVNSKAYESFLNKKDIHVFPQSCSMLVTLVEEQIESTKLKTSLFDFYEKDLNKEVDTLILGCTHFPFLKNDLKEYFKKKERKIILVDSTTEIKSHIASFEAQDFSSPELKVLISDNAEHFLNFIKTNLKSITNYSIEKI